MGYQPMTLNERRLKFWKTNHDGRILDTYSCGDFLEIMTRGHVWRVYGTSESNFYITEK